MATSGLRRTGEGHGALPTEPSTRPASRDTGSTTRRLPPPGTSRGPRTLPGLSRRSPAAVAHKGPALSQAPLHPDHSQRAHKASLAGLPPKLGSSTSLPTTDRKQTSLQRKGRNENTSQALTTRTPPGSTWD